MINDDKQKGSCNTKKKKRVVVTTCEAFRLASLYDYEVYSMNYENGFG